MDHSVPEAPFSSPYDGYLLLLVLGGLGFLAARRWPWSLWLTLPLLLYLASGQILGLLGALSLSRPAEETASFYGRGVLLAAVCLAALALPAAGAWRSRRRASRPAG